MGWGMAARPARSPHPLRTACWYWHHPFRLDAGDRHALEAARVSRLYVHAGTLALGDGALRLTSRQRWEASPACDVHAVLRVHPEANAALLEAGGAARAADLLREAG